LLVGASPDRTEELVAGLTAAGYTVSGTSDPHAIIKMAECEPRPPDAAVLDSSLVLPPDLAHRIERLFELREVPIINISGEPSYRARAVIDGLLAVHARTV
jgi:DNA-binding response OmpR family regulator